MIQDKGIETIIKENMGMIISIAGVYSKFLQYSYGDFEDLISEGKTAVVKCAPSYDSRCCSFYNYAHKAVRGAMIMYLSETRRGFGRPISFMYELNKITDAIFEIKMEKGEDYAPSEIEIEKRTGIKNVGKKRSLDLRVSSLQEPIPGKDKEVFLMDIIKDENSKSVESNTENYFLREEINQAFERLNKKEKIIMDKRYKINGSGKYLTLRECAKILHMTWQGVHQIEQRALKKLRRSKRLKEIFIDTTRVKDCYA